DVATGTERYRAEHVHFDLNLKGIPSLLFALAPKGDIVALGRSDAPGRATGQKIRLRNLATGEERVVHEGEDVSCLTFSPDGQLLAIGLHRETRKQTDLVLLEARTGRKRFVLGELPGIIFQPAFTRDGSKLAAPWFMDGTSSGGLWVWDLRAEQPSVTLR